MSVITPTDALYVLGLLCGTVIVVEVAKDGLAFISRRRGMTKIAHINTGEQFTDHWPGFEELIKNHKPHEAGDVEAHSISNWHRIPLFTRRKLVRHLRDAVLSNVVDGDQIIRAWQAQRATGMAIGSDEYSFHLGTGMWVRNTLRDVLRDGDLPASRNWDDYYYGALDELAGSP